MRNFIHFDSPPPASQANHRLADAVGDHLAGQQAAARLIERIREDCGDGNELADAVRGLDGRSEAYAKGFHRIIHKYLAAGVDQ